jgi:hypothetical protein
MVTNRKTGKTVTSNKKTSKTAKSNKKTGGIAKSNKKIDKTLKLKLEAKLSTKKQSLKVNTRKQSLKVKKVAKTSNSKTNKLELSATRLIKENIASMKKSRLKKSEPIGATTPLNISQQGNTNTVTEEKSVHGLSPNGGLGHDITDNNNNGAHSTLDTSEVLHNLHYYYSKYCSEREEPDQREHAKRRLLECLQAAGPLYQDQPTHASVESSQKHSIKQTTAAKDHCSNKEEKVPFYITTPPSKWTPAEGSVLSVLGSAEDQGVKVRGRLPSPRRLFNQETGIEGIGEQRKEDPFAVNHKCAEGKARLSRTSPDSVNPQEKRDTLSKDRHRSQNFASTELYITSIQPPKNTGIAGQEEERKAPFDISGVTNCSSKSLASIILNPQHVLGSKSLFAEHQSDDESDAMFSKNNDNLEGRTVHIDEDDSLNGRERSSVKETTTTEIFVERSSKGEQAASRFLDKSEVEDDWDGTFSHDGDYVEGRINETFVERPSKSERSPSRNSNQSRNSHKNDEKFKIRKVDKHHIDIHPSDLYFNTTSTKGKYLRGRDLFFTNLQELINDPEMRTLNSCLLCQVLYYKVKLQG